MNVLENKWFMFIYEGGSFPVSFRPFGVFYSPSFPASSSYTANVNPSTNLLELLVDFGKFGKFAFTSANGLQFEGYLVNTPEKWRKMEFARDFNDCERLMFTGGSAWSFEWAKGSFDVEFRADSFNHFVCPSFPAHSHWSLEDNRVYINWDKYGEYELMLDPATGTMTGSKKGQPDNWRRAKFLRSLGADGVTSVPAHDHGHSHAHGETCTHDH